MANIIVKRELIDDIRDGAFMTVPASELQAHSGNGKIGFKMSMKSFFKDVVRRSKAQNPISPNQADIVNWVLYDRFIFGPGTTIPGQFTFFSVPSGSAGKTNVDTNVTQVKRLEDPQWFNTCGVGFYVNPNVLLLDWNAFLNTEYMEFWVGQKAYLQGPIQCFPGAAGLTGFSTRSAESYYVNGTSRPMDYFDVRLPAGIGLGGQGSTDGLMGITILQGQAFYINCYAPAGGAALAANTASPSIGTGLTLMAYLYGILSRSVQ